MMDCPHGHALRRKCNTCDAEDTEAEVERLRGLLAEAREGLREIDALPQQIGESIEAKYTRAKQVARALLARIEKEIGS